MSDRIGVHQVFLSGVRLCASFLGALLCRIGRRLKCLGAETITAAVFLSGIGFPQPHNHVIYEIAARRICYKQQGATLFRRFVLCVSVTPWLGCQNPVLKCPSTGGRGSIYTRLVAHFGVLVSYELRGCPIESAFTNLFFCRACGCAPPFFGALLCRICRRLKCLGA